MTHYKGEELKREPRSYEEQTNSTQQTLKLFEES